MQHLSSHRGTTRLLFGRVASPPKRTWEQPIAVPHRLSALRLITLSFVSTLALAAPPAARAWETEGAPAGVIPTRSHAPLALQNPILFVTQVPCPADFTTVGSTFGNHQGDAAGAPRGGDLWILYPDGTLKNLTQTAGYGVNGFQGVNGIAVREPSVHWSGTKALFSMVIGTPNQYQWNDYFWQIYEITGLGKNETPVITKVPHQPASTNNVSPFYGSDDRVLFTSDRSRDGSSHLYPQLDEYEEAPTTTGIWSLDPVSGDLFLLEHAPSGSFSPSVDSFGRVVFSRWDHLQRDQQADADSYYGGSYGTFNWSSEAANSYPIDTRVEIFPEPRPNTPPLQGTNLVGHTFNIFTPWQVNEDGTEEETLVHIGRHELQGYFDRVFNNDPNLQAFNGTQGHRISNFLEMAESPTTPGTYVGIDAPEFYTHAAGQIIALAAPDGANPDQLDVTYLTHRDTSVPSENPSPNHSGLYRDPLPLSDGSIVAIHTAETRVDENDGTRAHPTSRYDFRLKTLRLSGGYWVADQTLTPVITKTVSYYDPDVLVTYSGFLWQLNPVEVRVRPRPTRRVPTLPALEAQVFAEEGVDVAAFRSYLSTNQLALVVSRDVTARDHADRQQPFNLRVPGGVQTVGAGGIVYDIDHMQFMQADLIRGLGGVTSPREGRRVLAQTMHGVTNPPDPSGPAGSVRISSDGSIAALVPAHRAMSWQSTGAGGTPIVRERYWLSFQPGEIRTCHACHGINTKNQANQAPPANKPEALRTLLQFWKGQTGVDPNAPVLVMTEAVPNPTRDWGQLIFDLDAPLTHGELTLFDASGRRIWVRALDQLPIGRQQLSVDWRSGSALPSGVYRYRLDVGAAGARNGAITLIR
ncbi:MAG: hypothetical protein U0527_14930 [Candidatus Eisenbacteria bacterium]